MNNHQLIPEHARIIHESNINKPLQIEGMVHTVPASRA
jgi:hypothetical protein